MRSYLILGLALLAGCGGEASEGPALIVGPAGANTFDELWVQIDDDNPDKYTVSWAVDGEPVSELTGLTVSPDNTRKGEEWTVTVSKGNRTSSASIEIGNAAPAATVSIDPPNPTSHDAITATGRATDPDNDPAYVQYRWVKFNRESETWEGYGSSVRTLPPVATRVDELWRIEVTPLDGDDEGPIGYLDFTIRNAEPIVNTLSLSSDTASTNDTLSVVATVFDEDGDAVTLEYQWVLNGTDVPGQTTRRYDGSLEDGFDAGDEVYVKVRGNDGEPGPWRSSPIVDVVNGPPTTPTASIEPAEPTEADDLQCVLGTPSVDPDPGDTVSYRAIWLVNGAPFTGGTRTAFDNDTVPADITAVDDTWDCTLVAYDALGNESYAMDTVDVAALSGCADGTSEVVWNSDAVGCAHTEEIAWSEARDNTATYCAEGWTMAGADVVNSLLNTPGYTDDWEFAFNGEGCSGVDYYATTNDSRWSSNSGCVWRRSHHTRLSGEDSLVDGVMCVRE